MSAGLTWRRFGMAIGLAAFALLAAVLVGLCVGSTGTLGWPAGENAEIIRQHRIHVTTVAAMVGLALGCAGAAYQSILRNDLADPYLLGIASGAALASYLWRMPAVAGAMIAIGPAAMVASQQAFAFAGAIVAAMVVLLLAGTRGRMEPAKLVLTGVIVSTICGAIILLLMTLVKGIPDAGYAQVFVGALQTSLSDAQRWTAGSIILIGSLLLAARSPRFNLLTLGDDEARSLGLAVARERLIGLVLASLVTAAGVSISGPIGFVGLIAPHVVRRIVGPDARLVVPLAGIGGAVLIVLADALLRYLAGARVVNTIIPIGVATALLGGPFFLSLLLRRKEGP